MRRVWREREKDEPRQDRCKRVLRRDAVTVRARGAFEFSREAALCFAALARESYDLFSKARIICGIAVIV